MELYGKKHALARLADFRRSGRFPHALLFCGAEGIGKHIIADYAAMMYMCAGDGERPCGHCDGCRRTEQHIHPDVVYPLSSMEKNTYHVEELREFITSCYTKPNDGDIRVCVFEDLDEMSPICQNALLKFIEEPLEFNRYIFIAKSRTPVLQTVLSRVTAVEVDGADEAEFTRAMTDNGIDRVRAAELFERFGGNIGAALGFENGGGEIQYLSAAIKAADAVAAKKELDCLNAFLSLKTREEIFDALGILSDIFGNTATVKAGNPSYGSYRAQTERLAGAYSLKAVSRLYNEAVRLYGMSFTNPNVKLFAAECCSALFNAAENP